MAYLLSLMYLSFSNWASGVVELDSETMKPLN